MYTTETPSISNLTRCLERLEKRMRADCDTHTLCRQLGTMLSRLFGVQYSGILELGPVTTLYKARTTHTLSSQQPITLSTALQSVVNELHQAPPSAQPFELPDHVFNCQTNTPQNTASALATPIYAQNKLWGMIIVCPPVNLPNLNDLQWFLYALSDKLSHILRPAKTDQPAPLWNQAMKSLPQLVCLLDKDGRILHSNQHAASWRQTPQHSHKGITLHEFLHPDCNTSNCQLLKACTPEQLALGCGRTLLCQNVDGSSKRELLVRLQALDGRTAAPESCFVAIMEDITASEALHSAWRSYNTQLEDQVLERRAQSNRLHQQLNAEIKSHTADKAALRQALQEKSLLSSQLLNAQETERRRIASELHDSVGQSLSSIKFNLEYWLGTTRQHPDDLDLSPITAQCEQIKSTISELRHIAMGLHPAMLDNLGLMITLEWLCREYQETYPQLRLLKTLGVTEDEISQPAKLAIYRICQEALTNIAKHARARHVELRLSSIRGRLLLTIHDDGRGFKQQATPRTNSSGLGLTSMRERTELLNGSFNIESAPELGTTLRITIPQEPTQIQEAG